MPPATTPSLGGLDRPNTECIVLREKTQPAASHNDRPLRVNSLHYRAATLLSASPQLAESIHAAKRFRVVPILLQKSFCTGDQKFSGP